MKRKVMLRAMLLAGIGIWVVGCATPKKYADYHNLYMAGNYAEAKAVLGTNPKADEEQANKKWLLEYMMAGSAEHMLGEHEQAKEDFVSADQIYEYDLRDEGLLGAAASQIGKTLTSDTSGMYRGRFFEGVMVGIYKAMESWAAGEDDNKVRMYLSQLEERQNAAIEHFERQLEAAEAEKQKEMDNAQGMNQGALKDTLSSQAMIEGEEALNRSAEAFGFYDSYDNPFAYYLDGLFRLVKTADNGNQLSKAEQSLKRAYGIGKGEGVKADYAIVRSLMARKSGWSPEKLNNYAWIIIENGMGPIRVENRLDLPLPINGNIVTVCLAWPELVSVDGAATGFSINDPTQSGEGEDKTLRIGESQPICSVDTLAATEYRTELKGIWTRQAISAAIKCMVQVVAQEAIRKKGNEGLAMLTGLALGAGSAAITHADTRCWSSLPKEILVMRAKIPTSNEFEIKMDGQQQALGTVHVLSRNEPTVLWVRAPSRSNVHILPLNGNVEIE